MVKVVEQIRAAAFDLDGTLIDTAPDLAVAANATLMALGRSALSEERIASLIGGGIERLVERALVEAGGGEADPRTLAGAVTLFRARYAERSFERSRVYPGVVQGLRQLRALGIPACCVTNKHSAFTRPLLDAAGLSDLVSFALCADRAEQRKPAPALLMAAAERCGVAPGELLYVGDSEIDIAAARAAGCPVAVVDYGYSGERALADAGPDWIIGSLVELTALPVRGVG